VERIRSRLALKLVNMRKVDTEAGGLHVCFPVDDCPFGVAGFSSFDMSTKSAKYESPLRTNLSIALNDISTFKLILSWADHFKTQKLVKVPSYTTAHDPDQCRIVGSQSWPSSSARTDSMAKLTSGFTFLEYGHVRALQAPSTA
jgi:hypothetical protein